MSFAHFLLTMLATIATTLLLWFDVIGFGWALILYLLLIARIVFAKGNKATLVNFIWAVLLIMMLCSFVSYWWLGQDRVQAAVYGKALIRSVITGKAGRAVLAILMGVLGSVLTIILPLYLILRVSTEWILALGQSMGIDRKLSWRLLFSLVLRINKPYIIVEDGEKKISKPAGILETIGGPGLVIVRPYNAIVCEQSGQVSQIVGSGLTTLDRFEFIKATITLRSKWESFELTDVMTMDHVPLLVRGGVGFRIMGAETARELHSRADRIMRNWHQIVGAPDYPVYQWTLYKAVYGVSEAKDWDWMKQAKGVACAQVRAAISQYRLDEIFIIDEQQRVRMHAPIVKAIADEAKKGADAITSGWGVMTNGMVVNYLEMPKKVQEDFLERWRSSWRGRARLVDGKVEMKLEQARIEVGLWKIIAKAWVDREAARFEEDTKRIAAIGEAKRRWEVMKIGTDKEDTRIAAAELQAELDRIEQLSKAENRQAVAEMDSVIDYIQTIISARAKDDVAALELQRRMNESRHDTKSEIYHYEHLTSTLEKALGRHNAAGVMKLIAKRRASIEQLKFICGVLDIANRGQRAMPGRWRIVAGDEGLEDEDIDEEAEA